MGLVAACIACGYHVSTEISFDILDSDKVRYEMRHVSEQAAIPSRSWRPPIGGMEQRSRY